MVHKTHIPPSFTPLNPPRSNSEAKRATDTSPPSSSKKPRQIEQEDDSGATGASQGLDEDEDIQ
jgi:hypothetical protein